MTNGQQARDAGMAQAHDHAEEVDTTWPQRAYAHLLEYAHSHAQFISHDVTDGCPSPTTQKAWGAIFTKAVREGVIEKIGYGISDRRHCSPTPLWQSRMQQIPVTP